MRAMAAVPLSDDDARRVAVLKEFGLPDLSSGLRVDTLVDCALQLHAQRERMSDFARASGDWMWEIDANLCVSWLSDTFSSATARCSRQISAKDRSTTTSAAGMSYPAAKAK